MGKALDQPAAEKASAPSKEDTLIAHPLPKRSCPLKDELEISGGQMLICHSYVRLSWEVKCPMPRRVCSGTSANEVSFRFDSAERGMRQALIGKLVHVWVEGISDRYALGPASRPRL